MTSGPNSIFTDYACRFSQNLLISPSDNTVLEHLKSSVISHKACTSEESDSCNEYTGVQMPRIFWWPRNTGACDCQ